MSISDIKKRFIVDDLNCWIQIDAISVRIGLAKLLNNIRFTVTKVVLPVPDMPIAMMHTFLFSLI